MAKKAKKTQAASGAVPAEELKRVIKEFARQSASASEYAGHAGQVIKTAVDRYNLDRKAFRFILALSKMEETKRQATLRGLLEYADKLEMFDQISLMDDIIDTMESIVERARSNEGRPSKVDPVVLAVVN